MKHEDIEILKLIKVLLSGNNFPDFDKVLHPNILKKIGLIGANQTAINQEDIAMLKKENKLLKERIQSQEAMTKVSLQQLMEEINELKKKHLDNTQSTSEALNQQIQGQKGGSVKSLMGNQTVKRNPLDQDPSDSFVNLNNKASEQTEKNNNTNIHSITERLQSDSEVLNRTANEILSKQKQEKNTLTDNQYEPFVEWVKVKEMIFGDRDKLSKYFTQAFTYPHKPKAEANSFYWMADKMGMTYIALVEGQAKINTNTKNQTVLFLVNFWLNKLILESRLSMSTQEIVQQIMLKLNENDSQEFYDGEQIIKIGICKIDRMNETLQYSGEGILLLIQQGDNIRMDQGDSRKDLSYDEKTRNKRDNSFYSIHDTNFFLMNPKEVKKLQEDEITEALTSYSVRNINEQGTALSKIFNEVQNQINLIVLGFKI